MKTISITPKSYGQKVCKSSIDCELKAIESTGSLFTRQFKFALIHKTIGAN